MAMKWQLSSSVHRILTFGVLGGREQFEVLALYPASACRKKVTVELDRCFKANVQKLNCLVTNYTGSDRFLENLILANDAAEFTRTLKSLMINGNINFHKDRPDQPPTSTSTALLGPEDTTEGEELDTNSFQAVVETFRRLHPANSQCDSTEGLDSKNKEWRGKCMAALRLDLEKKTAFGGSYEEHIAVSVMSRRCFDVALSIMKQYRLNKLLNQSSRIVNRALFKEVPGTCDEEALFQALLDFRDGRTGKEKFNQTLQIMKRGQKTDEQTKNKDNEKLRRELKRQQAIVETQQKKIASLEAEIKILKAGASRGNSQEEVVTSDIYEFPSEDSVHVTDDDLDEGASGEDIMMGASEEEESITGVVTQQHQQVQRFIENQREREEADATVGKMMEGKDQETGMWFKVKIIDRKKSLVKVHWMTYSKDYDSWLEQKLLRPIKPKFSEGDLVTARYNISYKTVYPATVVAVDGDKVFVRYEDDLEKRIHQRYVKARDNSRT